MTRPGQIIYFMKSAVAGIGPVKTVRQALRLVVSVEVLLRFEEETCSGGDLLEAIAEFECFSPIVLLEEVAALLGVQSIKKVHLPNLELLRQIPMNSVEMRQREIVPQCCEALAGGICLAVADPFSVRGTALAELPMRLTLRTEIERCWEALSQMIQSEIPGTTREATIPIILKRMAEDAQQFGSQEVFVGVPDNESYEFHARGQIYRGVISSSVIRELNDWLGPAEMRRLQSSDAEELRVFVSRGSGGNGTTYILHSRG